MCKCHGCGSFVGVSWCRNTGPVRDRRIVRRRLGGDTPTVEEGQRCSALPSCQATRKTGADDRPRVRRTDREAGGARDGDRTDGAYQQQPFLNLIRISHRGGPRDQRTLTLTNTHTALPWVLLFLNTLYTFSHRFRARQIDEARIIEYTCQHQHAST